MSDSNSADCAIQREKIASPVPLYVNARNWYFWIIFLVSVYNLDTQKQIKAITGWPLTIFLLNLYYFNDVSKRYEIKNDHFWLLFSKNETLPHDTFSFPISKRIELEQWDCAQMKALFKSFQMVF